MCFDQIYPPLLPPPISPSSSSLFSPNFMCSSIFFLTHRVHFVLCVYEWVWESPGAWTDSLSVATSLKRTEERLQSLMITYCFWESEISCKPVWETVNADSLPILLP